MNKKPYLEFLKKINACFPQYSMAKDFCLKAKQVQCMEALQNGIDVIAVLPTGFGKSLIFHLLPQILPNSEYGIVLVVAPLTVIIRDQIKDLQNRGISADVLNLETCATFVDGQQLWSENSNNNKESVISKNIQMGNIRLLFGHPESFLCGRGRSLLKTEIFQKNVSAIVVDEAHCIEMW